MGAANPYRREMERLVGHGVVEIVGPIRQELLSGVREGTEFDAIRSSLRAFVDLPISTDDHEEAASYYNHCRGKGVQGSATDFLICAVAVKHDLAIFTDDRDFVGYSRHLPIRLHSIDTTK